MDFSIQTSQGRCIVDWSHGDVGQYKVIRTPTTSINLLILPLKGAKSHLCRSASLFSKNPLSKIRYTVCFQEMNLLLLKKREKQDPT